MIKLFATCHKAQFWKVKKNTSRRTEILCLWERKMCKQLFSKINKRWLFFASGFSNRKVWKSCGEWTSTHTNNSQYTHTANFKWWQSAQSRYAGTVPLTRNVHFLKKPPPLFQGKGSYRPMLLKRKICKRWKNERKQGLEKERRLSRNREKGKKIGKLKIKGHNKSKMGKKKSNRKDSRTNTGTAEVNRHKIYT
jgi:hypothetical protein